MNKDLKNNIDISNLSLQEVKDFTVVLLNKIALNYNPQKGLGTELFNAIARLKITMTPEIVCFRKHVTTNALEVYLIRRALSDTAYPGQWHIPGSAMRPTEEIEDVFLRLEEKEIGLNIVSKKFVFHFNNPKEARGHFFSLVYLGTLEEGSGHGKWFAVDGLPLDTVAHHRDEMIPHAATLFINS